MEISPTTEALAVRLTELRRLLETLETESHTTSQRIDAVRREMEVLQRWLRPGNDHQQPPHARR